VRMMTINLLDFDNFANQKGVILSFHGNISQNILVEIGEMLEIQLQKDDIEQKVIFSLFSVLTEQVQNILKYSENNNDALKKGTAVMGFSEEKNKYFVASGNYINDKDKTRIFKKLEEINALSKDELKKLYRDLRKSGRDKHSKGAGLGFIEMARIGSEPLEYLIQKTEDNKNFFQISVYI
jgi:hypothetical protein